MQMIKNKKLKWLLNATIVIIFMMVLSSCGEENSSEETTTQNNISVTPVNNEEEPTPTQEPDPISYIEGVELILTNDEITGYIGMSKNIELEITKEDELEYPQITYSSDNEEVATVTEEGTVIFQKEGNCIITINLVDFYMKDSISKSIKCTCITPQIGNDPQTIRNGGRVLQYKSTLYYSSVGGLYTINLTDENFDRKHLFGEDYYDVDDRVYNLNLYANDYIIYSDGGDIFKMDLSGENITQIADYYIVSDLIVYGDLIYFLRNKPNYDDASIITAIDINGNEIYNYEVLKTIYGMQLYNNSLYFNSEITINNEKLGIGINKIDMKLSNVEQIKSDYFANFKIHDDSIYFTSYTKEETNLVATTDEDGNLQQNLVTTPGECGIYKISFTDDTKVKIIDGKISNFIIFNDMIYYLSANTTKYSDNNYCNVYKADITGKNNKQLVVDAHTRNLDAIFLTDQNIYIDQGKKRGIELTTKLLQQFDFKGNNLGNLFWKS